MKRREFVTNMGLGVSTAIGLSALGSLIEESASAAEKAAPTRPAMSPELKAVLNDASDCVKTGNICLAHCQSLLAKGDTSIADCQQHVMNVVAVCEALVKVAAYHNADDARIKSFAKSCAGFCDDCAKACEPHVGHHAECKACYDSCKKCAAACEKYSA